MRFTLSLLAIGLVLTGLLSCTSKQKSTQLTAEPRTLRIYRDGVFEYSIDVSGWEVNEDVVILDHFYYPWQGEDSIDYDCYLPFESEKIWGDAMVLNVNGKMVGVSTDLRPPDKIARPEDIKTVMSYYDDKDIIRYLKFFSNLIGVRIDIDSTQELKRLDSIPMDLKLYVDCNRLSNNDLKKISRFHNIRMLALVDCSKITDRGLRHIRRLNGLRRVRILYMPQITEEGLKHLRSLPKLRILDVNEGWRFLHTIR